MDASLLVSRSRVHRDRPVAMFPSIVASYVLVGKVVDLKTLASLSNANGFDFPLLPW